MSFARSLLSFDQSIFMPTCPSSDQSDGKTHQRRSRASRGCGVTSSRSLGARARASGTDSASSSMYLASDPSKSGVTVLTLGHIQDEGARVHTRPRVRVRACSTGGGYHQEGDDSDATAPAECAGTGHADASVCSAVSARMRQLFGEQWGSCNSREPKMGSMYEYKVAKLAGNVFDKPPGLGQESMLSCSRRTP